MDGSTNGGVVLNENHEELNRDVSSGTDTAESDIDAGDVPPVADSSDMENSDTDTADSDAADGEVPSETDSADTENNDNVVDMDLGT